MSVGCVCVWSHHSKFRYSSTTHATLTIELVSSFFLDRYTRWNRLVFFSSKSSSFHSVIIFNPFWCSLAARWRFRTECYMQYSLFLLSSCVFYFMFNVMYQHTLVCARCGCCLWAAIHLRFEHVQRSSRILILDKLKWWAIVRFPFAPLTWSHAALGINVIFIAMCRL